LTGVIEYRATFIRLILLFLSAALVRTAAAQEMEPRAYSPAPSGAQFVLLSYGHQTGDVLLDASLPLETAGAPTRYRRWY